MSRRRSRLATVVALAASALLLGGCSIDGNPTASTVDAGSPSSSTGELPTEALPTLPPPSTGPSGAPVTAEGAFRVTDSDEIVVAVTVIEDMACPACRAFDRAYRDVLEQIAALPHAAVDYRIISFLDRMSTDAYSSRAANASYCVWNRTGPQSQRQREWLAFQHALFDAQPAEGGAGLPDEKLVELAASAGALDVGPCITGGRYRADVARTSDSTLAEPTFSGTPTVLVNGEKVELRQVSTLMETVKALLPE